MSFSVGGAEGYLTASSYPDDGLGEVFLKMSKQGSTLAGVMDAFSVAISIGLQYGVPLETYVSKFTNMRFEPAGMTDDPDIRMAASVMDYIFRRLALDFLPYEPARELGIFTAAERAAQRQAPRRTSASPAPVEEHVDFAALASSAPIEAARSSRRSRRASGGTTEAGTATHGGQRQADRPRRLVDGVAGTGAGQGCRRAAVLHLRHEDAPGRQLLRLRGLRLDQRLQLNLWRSGARPAPDATAKSRKRSRHRPAPLSAVRCGRLGHAGHRQQRVRRATLPVGGRRPRGRAQQIRTRGSCRTHVVRGGERLDNVAFDVES